MAAFPVSLRFWQPLNRRFSHHYTKPGWGAALFQAEHCQHQTPGKRIPLQPQGLRLLISSYIYNSVSGRTAGHVHNRHAAMIKTVGLIIISCPVLSRFKVQRGSHGTIWGWQHNNDEGTARAPVTQQQSRDGSLASLWTRQALSRKKVKEGETDWTECGSGEREWIGEKDNQTIKLFGFGRLWLFQEKQ